MGNLGNISHVQVIGNYRTGAGSDNVEISLMNAGSPVGLSAGLTGLLVQCGSGNDIMVDATKNTLARETLQAGGNDVIKISTSLATGSQVAGSTSGGSTELDIEDTISDDVTVSDGALSIGGTPEEFTGFDKLVVVGGSGNATNHATNNFSTDGTIQNAVFEGGAGPYAVNNLTAGGTSNSVNTTLIGGSGADNTFNVTGPGNYTVIGGGPTVAEGPLPTLGVTAPTPPGISQISTNLSQARNGRPGGGGGHQSDLCWGVYG